MGAWCAEIAAVEILSHGMGFPLAHRDALWVLVVLNLAVAIPVSPGSLGPFEVAMAFGLSRCGVPGAAATAIACTHHFIQILGIVVCTGLLVPAMRWRAAKVCRGAGQRNQLHELRLHYGPWARTYGQPTDDGFFMSLVRARENRIIEALLQLRGGESILDAGCGTGAMARVLKAAGHEVWAVDCTPEMVAMVDGHVDRALVADLNELRLERTFDLILCIGALEFSPDARTVLARLRSHLATGGRLILLVPRTGPGGWAHRFIKSRAGLHSRLFSPHSLRRLGQETGFRFKLHRTPFIHNFIAVLEAA